MFSMWLFFADFNLNIDNVGNITIGVNETMACLNESVSYIVDDDLYETDQGYSFQVTGPNVTDGSSSTEYVILDSTGKLHCKVLRYWCALRLLQSCHGNGFLCGCHGNMF